MGGVSTTESHEIMRYHCIIHQEALCPKAIGFEGVMSAVIKDVNFIRSYALNHRQFKFVLDEFNAEYSNICFYTEVRWLSRGKVLERVFELRNVIVEFLLSKGRECLLTNSEFESDVGYLADITSQFNSLNTQLQGKSKNILDMIVSVDAFTNKLTPLKRQLVRKDITHFPLLKSMGKDCRSAQYYIPSIDRLIEQFTDRFVDFRRYQFEFDLISNPIIFDIDTASINLQLELLSLQSDPIIKADYQIQINKRDLLAFYKHFHARIIQT